MKNIYLLFSFLIIHYLATGQVSSYTFSQAVGSYSSISGGTLLIDGSGSTDSWVSGAITIPSFTFNGTSYTTAYMTSNGQITLGGSAPSSSTYTGISSTIGSGIAICPFSADLLANRTNGQSEMRWQTVGSEVIFQWKNWRRYLTTEEYSFQVRLNTSTGVIMFVYDLGSGPDVSTSYQPQVGIRTSATDYNNRKVTTTENWATSTAGTANNNTCRFSGTAPATNFVDGLTYTWTPPIACSAPSTQASAFTSSSITTTTMTVGWTRGNGNNVMVIAKAGSAPTDPISGTSYTADAAYGSGTAVGGGFCVYNGTGTSVNLTALTSSTTYYFAVYEYNTTGPCYNLTQLTGNVSTLDCWPSTQATSFSASSITASAMTIGWVRGNGNNVMVIAKAGSAPTDPVQGTSYSANTVYGSGTAVGGGFCVYNGTGTSVTITGLSSTTIYYFAIYEYNTTGTCYFLTELTGNATTLCGISITLPFTESFDGATFPPTCWLNTQVSGTGLWQRSTSGSYPTCSPHSGAGMAYFNSYSYSSGTTSNLITPSLPLVTGSCYSVSFWVYGQSSYYAYDYLDVYVNSSPQTTGGTQIGSSIYIDGFDGWVQYTYEIPVSYSGSGTYIIFEGYSAQDYNIFIDDVSVNAVTSPVCATYTSPTNGSTGVCNLGTTLSWGSVSGATGYKVYMDNNPSPTTLVSTVTSPTYTTGSLTIGSTYFWKVVPTNCSGDAVGCTVWSFTAVGCYLMDDNPVSACAGSFSDSEGPSGDYWDDEDYTKTFTSTTGANLIFTFTSFDTESGYDYLYVYDGPTTASPQVAGSPFSGTTIPGPISSSGSSLTFNFTSDSYTEYSGWEASISCGAVTAVPNCATLVSPASGATGICPGSGATLNWTPSGTGFTPTSYQLFFGTNNPPTNIINGTDIGNVTSYSTTPLNSNTIYYWEILPVNSFGTNNTCTTVNSFTTENINITSTNSPVTTCQNTAALTATGSGTINWYTSPTGGSSIATGSPYNATFSGNTTYYVGASSGSFANYTGGKTAMDVSCDYYYGYGSSEYGLSFTASTAFTLNSVDVYVETMGSTVVIQLQDGTGTNIGSPLTFSSLPSGLNTLSLNLSIPSAGDYLLVSTNSTYLAYDDDGCTTISFPYSIPGVLSITSSTSTYGTYVDEYDYFYNWKVTVGISCECARVPVNVIHTAPAITITPSGPTTFPLGGSVGLTAASTASPGYTYTWSPSTGLNTTTGSSVIASPLVTTIYTVTGTNGTPCTQTASVTVEVIQPCTGLGTGLTNIGSLPYSIIGQTTTGMVDDITSSNALVCGNSSYYSGNDVVYSFTPTTSGSITINLTSSGSYTGLMLYEGCPMSGQGGICVTYNQSSSGSKNLCVTVDAGSAYYLVIDSYSLYSSTNPYDLSISAPDPNSTPNDLPCNAELFNSGDLTPGDNSCASNVGEPSPPSCWANGNINTVWYKLTTGAAQTSIKIKTIVGTLLNTQIAIYSGACGSGMSFVACNDDGASCGSSQYYNSELTTTVSPSTTYYIAVDGHDNLTGTFSIVWIDGTASWPSVPGQDCTSGVPVCASTFTIGNPGYQAVGNICDFGDDYCLLTGERGSAWYEITVNANGDLMFTIEPNDVVPPIGTAGVVTDDGTDYDWAIWKKTGSGSVTCAQIASGTSTPLRCNYSSIGITGLYTGGNNPTALNTYTNHTYSSGAYDGAYEAPLTVSNGEVYWLVISNFSNSLSGFTINFNNSTNGFNFAAPNPLIWTGGAASTDWFNPLNWGNCAIIPSATIDCIIAASSIYQPVINAAGAVCKSITINPGANLTINATRNLDIYGNYNNQGTLNANSSSTVTMTGTAAQTMDGIMTTPSEFGNLTINKTAGSVQLNQNIETTANLTTLSATSILNTNSNYVTTAGNIALNSPATYTGVGTTGTLEMNGSAAQTINAGTGTLDLCNFTMNNTSSGVTTNNDIQLNTSGVFTLTNGIITTGTNKIIVLNTASTSTSNGTSTSFVNGNLRRHIVSNTNTYAFPVGAGAAYRLAEIINNNLTPTTYFDSKFLTSFTNTGSLNPSTAVDAGTVYNSIASEGIWQIDPNTAPTGGSYSINLWFNGGGTNAFSGLTDNQFGPLKRISTSTSAFDWTALGGTLNAASTPGRTVAGGYARRNNWSAFSHFAIGKTLVPLPIELLSFNGYCNPANVELKWATSQEVNNDFFTLEQSMDGIHFLPLGNISGAGNSNNQNNYSFIDNSYNSGIANSIYYRIKQTDFDGRTTISETISVHCTEVNSNDNIFIINQPESEDIQINFTGKIGQMYKVSFIDYLGRSLSSQEIVLQNNEQSVSIDKTGLAIGLYHLVIRSETNVYSKQVVITSH